MSDEKEKDQIIAHDYDGIQEYDNKLPRWWLGTFYLTIIFGLFYWMHYHVLQTGQTQNQEFLSEMEAHNKLSEHNNNETGGGHDTNITNINLKDSSIIAAGQNIYATNCATCHADKGQGLVGPNLTDAYWIHGGSPEQIKHVILNGVPEKGMIAWQGILPPEQINQILAYILSLQGSNPPGGKGPEGDLHTVE